jgi:uncharacterized tellurite resistance protein B-like protein
MSSFLQRLLGQSRTSDLAIAELQLRLLVAMAAADHRINSFETDQIADFIDRVATTDRSRARLHALLDELLATPPQLGALLHELAHHADATRLGKRLVNELAHVAWSDDEVDHREEFLLDLVCDVFGMPPRHLLDAAHEAEDDFGDLHRFVHRLARTDRHAA